MPSRPDAHLSTVPSVQTTCHTVWTPDTPSIIRLDPPLCREVSIHLAYVSVARRDASYYSTSFRFFPSSNMGRLIQPSGRCGILSGCASLKARIVIQISPSGRQSALVWTRVQQLRKLPIRLQPSGRLSALVRTRT
jgi:hypothetical protein